jgi:glycosyltransferase involved in cell wall biosynthesis
MSVSTSLPGSEAGTPRSGQDDPPAQWMIRHALRVTMRVYFVLASIFARVRRQRPIVPNQPLTILLTGTFHSSNWARAHLTPLAAAARSGRVRVVSTEPLPPSTGVDVIRPPAWLCAVIGGVQARLLTFIWVALSTRPEVVGGFHLLVNGLVAGLVARLIGARSLYFCVGGPMELADGGIWSENRIFGRLRTPDPVIESQLLAAVADMTIVITMGTKARDYLAARGIRSSIWVVPGGIDPTRFFDSHAPRDIDLILVGRLVQVKRIDRFIQAVGWIGRRDPGVSAVIVGDGPLRGRLEDLTRLLGISDNVRFVGSQDDVGAWLRRAKIFALTSESEGLALSLMEATSCGAVPIVSNVGDLADLVDDGVNGHLVSDPTPELFAAAISGTLRSPERLERYRRAALMAAARFRPELVTLQWNEVLTALDGAAGSNSVDSVVAASPL